MYVHRWTHRQALEHLHLNSVLKHPALWSCPCPPRVIFAAAPEEPSWSVDLAVSLFSRSRGWGVVAHSLPLNANRWGHLLTLPLPRHLALHSNLGNKSLWVKHCKQWGKYSVSKTKVRKIEIYNSFLIVLWFILTDNTEMFCLVSYLIVCHSHYINFDRESKCVQQWFKFPDLIYKIRF